MNINSSMQAGLQGLHKNLNGLQQAADKVVSAPVAASEAGTGVTKEVSDQVAEGLVEMKLYELGAKASTQVVKASDRALGTLLDTFA